VKQRRLQLGVALGVIVALGAVGVAVANLEGNDIREQLSGYEEVPTLSTPGHGTFEARMSGSSQEIEYELSYADLPTAVTAAHIHLGARATNGGVSAFLCGGGDKPACPPSGTVTGTIDPADVIGPAAQGITAGEFDELVRAIRAGATYANVHTTERPGGEIRAQLEDPNRSD
jgi:hypothetical protein